MHALQHTQVNLRARRRTALASVAVSVSCIGLCVCEAGQAASEPKEVRPLEEVIVTAQKREEQLQKVPISISVLSGVALERSNQSVARELARVPGFAVMESGFGSGKLLTVRGVASTAANFSGTSTVGYYLDSVPFGFSRQAITPDASSYDLAQVEVLRGPQGTLYGVSAANGVIRVLTQDADLDEYQFKFRTSGSTTDGGGENYRGDVAVNVPLMAGKLGVRAVVGYEQLSGWIDRPGAREINGGDYLTARLKVNAQPTDKLSMELLAWHNKGETDGRSLAREDMTTSISIAEPNAETYDIYGLKLGYEFSAFSLTSASSYIDYLNESTVTFGGTSVLPLFSDLSSEILAQEFNLVSTGTGPWRWGIGAIYRDSKDLVHQRTIPGLVFANPNGSAYNDYSTSFAVFGELTRLLMDGKFEVTAGLRYFEDDAETKQVHNPSSVTGPLVTNESKFDARSPRVVVTWHPSDRLTTYVSYAEGFRSGFSQTPTILSLVPDFPSVDSDNLTNYELGMKGSTAGGAVSFESAVFFMDWEGIQQQINVPLPGFPNGVNGLVNGKSASGLGAEIGFTFHPTDALGLGLNYAWNDLAFDEDVVTGAANTVLFPKDARMANSPEHTAGAWVEYGFSLGSGYEALLTGSFNYTSERIARLIQAGRSQEFVDQENLPTSRLSLRFASLRGWSATLFVDNLTNEKGGSTLPVGVGPVNRPIEGALRIRPRTIGLQFEYRP